MTGIFINLLIFGLGSATLAAGISFFIQEKEDFYFKMYCMLFGITNFLICAGYSVMSFTPYVEWAFIPRLVGLFGIDVFLLLQLAFLLFRLKIKLILKEFFVIIFAVYIFCDLMFFGRPSVVDFVRHDFSTCYEKMKLSAELFHCSYMLFIALFLILFAVQWYKSRKIKRDKVFVIQIVFANCILILTAIPDIFRSTFTMEFPYFGYCVSFTLVFFAYWIAIKNHLKFLLNIKNVSREIFYTIDVPVLILNMDGTVVLYNPCAEKCFGINAENMLHELKINDLFSITDVLMMRIFAKANAGEGSKYNMICKANGEKCGLTFSVRLDETGETFCIICTVKLPEDENGELRNEN